MLNTLTTATPTMTSSELTNLLNEHGANYKKSRINEKIRDMFAAEIDDTRIVSSLDNRGYVVEYHLPELESTMFVGKWHTPFLRQLAQYWIDRKNVQPISTGNPLLDALVTTQLQVQAQSQQLIETAQKLEHLTDKVNGFKVADVIPANVSSTKEIQRKLDYYINEDALKRMLIKNLPVAMYNVESAYGIQAAYFWNTTQAMELMGRICVEAKPVNPTSKMHTHDDVDGMFKMVLK